MNIATMKRRGDCVEIPSGMGSIEHSDVAGRYVEDEELWTPGSQNSRRPRIIVKYIKSVRTERNQYEGHERMMESMTEKMKASNRMLCLSLIHI